MTLGAPFLEGIALLMSKTLTFDLDDEVAGALTDMAARTGSSFEELALQWLVRYRTRPTNHRSAEDRQRDVDRLRSHAGRASLGRPTGTDNAAIDRDLAREYEGRSDS
jgi:hypothetical protein